MEEGIDLASKKSGTKTDGQLIAADNPEKQSREALLYELMSVSLFTASTAFVQEKAKTKTPEPIGQIDKKELKGEQLFDRSRIDKILRIRSEKVDGKTKEIAEEVSLKDNEKLKSGTYEVQFKPNPFEVAHNKSGRAFRVHIPEGTPDKAPVMFVVPGVSTSFQDPRGYIKEVHMDDVADRSKNKAIIVTPLTEKHLMGGRSTSEAWGWNYRNTLVPTDLVEKHKSEVKYDDSDYMIGVVNLVKELTTATNDDSRLGWTGGSQGAVLLHNLACFDQRFKGKMRYVYFAGGSIPTGADARTVYDPGINGVRSINYDTVADEDTLAHKWKEPGFLARNAKILAGLDAINNKDQDPDRQAFAYLGTDNSGQVLIDGKLVKIYRNPGDHSKEYKVKAFVAKDNDAKLKTAKNFEPGSNKDQGEELKTQEAVEKARAAKKDIRWVYEVARRGVKVNMDEYELLKARHCFPGSKEDSTSTRPKYDGINGAQIIYDDFFAQLARLDEQEKNNSIQAGCFVFSASGYCFY